MVLDPSTGFAVSDTILVTADILVLSEQTQSVRENELISASSNASAEVLSGKFTWKVNTLTLGAEHNAHNSGYLFLTAKKCAGPDR